MHRKYSYFLGCFTSIGAFVVLIALSKIYYNSEENFDSQRYNVAMAKRLPLLRPLPTDLRDTRCPNLTIDADHDFNTPTVAIIIIFRNENPQMLYRTLRSIYDRTPMYLIVALTIVDDYSEMTEQERTVMDEYLAAHFDPAPRILHLEERLGLMGARTLAAAEIDSDIVVFVDTHVEVTDGWLEPLISPIYIDNIMTITVPMLDEIDPDTFEYRRVKDYRTIFDWSLTERHVELLPAQVKALPEPYESPVIGAVFAVNGGYILDIMDFDSELTGSTGAQIELSLKAWLCSGRVLQVPCSRVGRLSRTKKPGNVSLLNLKRIVEAWMDDHKNVVYQHFPQLQTVVTGDLSEPKEYQKLLDCKPFDWYLQEVAPEMLHI